MTAAVTVVAIAREAVFADLGGKQEGMFERPALSDGVKDAVVAELPKDLTNVPSPQLERHFETLLPV